MNDDRHQTITDILQAMFSLKVNFLLIEDMLSNYCFKHGEEKYLSSKFLNSIEPVAAELKKLGDNVHQSVADAHDYSVLGEICSPSKK